MGEVGVVCCGDEGECDGENGAPDGLSLVSSCVFALRRPPLFRTFAGFGTFAAPTLETLSRGKTVLLACLPSSFSSSRTSGEASPGSVSTPVAVAVFVSDSMCGAVSFSKRDAAVAAAETGFLASLSSG